jgi:hypothetical protein
MLVMAMYMGMVMVRRAGDVVGVEELLGELGVGAGVEVEVGLALLCRTGSRR